jgi:diaminopimelate decarboxylase
MSAPFEYKGGELCCESVPLAQIADEVGTPVYVYSARAIRDAYAAIDAAFASYPHAIHYALKANSTLAIARLLQSLGSRADANSGGEVTVALRAGFSPDEIVFTGVGKTRDELEYAIGLDVGTINAESAGELDRIAALAHAQGRVARVALRVNPDIDARTHANISTGLKTNKFGVPLDEALAIYRERRALPGVRFVGVHVHIGSQITTAEPLCRAARALVSLAIALRDDGFALEHVDLGGGLGIAYEGRPMITPAEYAAAVLPELRRVGIPVVLEPGRAIVGHSGALVARVVDTKRYPDGRQFAVLDTGAYGAVMASNYNRHLLAPEVLVEDGMWRVIRRRQTLDDVLALES